MIANTFPGEYLIAVLIAAAIVVSFRRKTPRVLELAVWITLVWVCVLTIRSNGNPQARALTSATVWGASMIVGMIAAVSGHDTLMWLYGARFAIADLTVLVFAVDVLALALVSTKRQADAWIPVTRLGDWMLLPRLSIAEPYRPAPSAVDEINQRFNSWAPSAAAASLAWSILLIKRWRNFEFPRAARGLKNFSLVAGVAWRRVAAGRPQLGEVRISHVVLAPSTDAAQEAIRSKGAAAKPAPLGVNIVAIKSLGESGAEAHAGTTPRRRRGRAAPIPPPPDSGIDKNGSPKRHRQDRLAS